MATQSTTKPSLSQRWENYQPSKTMLVWACIAAAIATIIVGFAWGGWVTGGTSQKMAVTAGDTARGDLASAICVEKFNAAPAAVVGGAHTERRLPKRRRGQRNSTSGDIIAAIRQLVLIASDDLIAGILNRNGLVTGHGNRWTRERVTAHRSHHKIPVFRPAPDGNEPWLNLNKAARLLGVAPKTLRLAAEAGEIEGVHPLPDGPWIFSRSELGKPQAQQILHRARQNPKYPAGSHPDQQNLFPSTA